MVFDYQVDDARLIGEPRLLEAKVNATAYVHGEIAAVTVESLGNLVTRILAG